MKIIKLTPQPKQTTGTKQLVALLYNHVSATWNHPLQFIKNNPNFLTSLPGIIA